MPILRMLLSFFSTLLYYRFRCISALRRFMGSTPPSPAQLAAVSHSMPFFLDTGRHSLGRIVGPGRFTATPLIYLTEHGNVVWQIALGHGRSPCPLIPQALS
ncbi:hypothetical protein BJV74DRAFT_829088 [Russula compacta]|nr:hypothetical protein BJV74DRAFT_829088 [Russula compacta]